MDTGLREDMPEKGTWPGAIGVAKRIGAGDHSVGPTGLGWVQGSAQGGSGAMREIGRSSTSVGEATRSATCRILFGLVTQSVEGPDTGKLHLEEVIAGTNARAHTPPADAGLRGGAEVPCSRRQDEGG